MATGGLFNRRRKHNNTPKSVLLIFSNFVVVLVSSTLFTSCNHINSFFWVIVAGLGVYNYFTIRRFRDEYDKITVISYVISMVVLIGLFLIFILSGQNC